MMILNIFVSACPHCDTWKTIVIVFHSTSTLTLLVPAVQIIKHLLPQLESSQLCWPRVRLGALAIFVSVANVLQNTLDTGMGQQVPLRPLIPVLTVTGLHENSPPEFYSQMHVSIPVGLQNSLMYLLVAIRVAFFVRPISHATAVTVAL